MEPTDAASNTPSPAPRHRPGRQPIPAGGLADFLSLPTGTSMIFLLSAACILGGVWAVAAPIFADPEQLPSWFGILGVVHGYEAALLVVALLLNRWQRGNPDAIGLGVVIAAFVVGSSVVLDTVSIGAPGWTLVCGVTGLLLAVGKGVALGRSAGGLRTSRLLLGGVSMLLAWNGLWPGLLGLYAANALPLEAWRLWLPGWWLTLAGGALLLAGVVRDNRPEVERGAPFVLRGTMRWIMGFVVLACSGIHQYSLGYTHSLPLVASDFLPLAMLLCLGLGEMRARAFANHAFADGAIAGLPVAMGVLAMCCGEPGLALESPLSAVSYPPLVLAASAGLCAWLGWRRSQPALHAVAFLAALAATWTWGAEQPGHGFNHLSAATALAVILAALAWRFRSPRVAMSAVIAISVLVTALPAVQHRLDQWEIAWPCALLALAGAGALAVCLRWPRAFSTAVPRMAALALVAGMMVVFFKDHSPWHAPLLGTAILVAGLAASSWRLGDGWVSLPGGLPGAAVLPQLLPDNKGWLAIWVAFALLAIGAFASYRRTRRLPALLSAQAEVAEHAELTAKLEIAAKPEVAAKPEPPEQPEAGDESEG